MSARACIAVLAALTLVRLAAAAATPLSPDEAYYWVWSRALAPGFYDHPPMVALWIRAGTALAGPTALGVRVLGPVAALLGSALLARAGRDLLGFDRDRAWRAALLLNATLMVGVGAVTMTPDTPLLLFWTAALCCAGRCAATGRDRWLPAIGACLGLGFDSKYTALLLVPPLLVWLARLRGARALRSPAAWSAAGAALLAVAPVLAWNAAHHWASLRKQGGRIDHAGSARALRYLSELVLGQLGLATPLLFALFALGAGALLARIRAPAGAGVGVVGDGDGGGADRPARAGATLVLLATLVPLAVFAWHALGARVQANWPCVAYPSAALGAALVARGRGARSAGAAAGLGLAVTLAVYAQAATGVAPLPRGLDATLARLGGWPELGARVRGVAASRGLPVASDEYGLASELDWNRAAPAVLAAEPRWSLFDLPRAPGGGDVLLVRRFRTGEPPPDASLWPGARLLAIVPRARRGRVAERYGLWLARASAPVIVRLP